MKNNDFFHIAKVIDYEKSNIKTKDALIKNSLELLGLNYKKINSLYIIEDKYYIRHDISEKTSIAAYYATSGHKWMTTHFLDQAGVSYPDNLLFNINDYDKALYWAEKKKFNIVIKPNDGELGNNVYLNIMTKKYFDEIWGTIFKEHKTIIMEEMIRGKDYRLLVIGGHFCAATIREPLYIIGNGKSSVLELITIKNEKRVQHPYISVRRMITIDEEIKRKLIQQGFRLDSILKNNQKVYLRDMPKIAKGGEHSDITEFVHLEFKRIVEKAFKFFPPSCYFGFDIIAEDISKHPDDQKWAIIEADAHASLVHHHLPVNGVSRDVISLMLLDNLKNNKFQTTFLKAANIAKIYKEDYNLLDIGYAVHKQLLKKASWNRNLKVETINNRLWSVEDQNKKHFF